MSRTAYRILSGMTCLMSLTSVIGSAYLCRSWFTKKRKNKQELLNEYIAYMSFAECIFAIYNIICYINPTMDWDLFILLPHGICVMVGVITQCLLLLTTTFNFALSAFIFLPIIRGTPMRTIERRRSIHLTFVFTVTFICTIAPLFGNHYGLANTSDDNYGLAPYECWITETDKNYYLFLYLPATIYCTFALCLMVYAKLMVNAKYYQTLIDQLTWYTIAFIWVWCAAIAGRIYNAATNKGSPFWMLCLKEIGLSSMGTVKAFIWWNYLEKDTQIQMVEPDSNRISLQQLDPSDSLPRTDDCDTMTTHLLVSFQ
eukprot:362013_1